MLFFCILLLYYHCSLFSGFFFDNAIIWQNLLSSKMINYSLLIGIHYFDGLINEGKRNPWLRFSFLIALNFEIFMINSIIQLIWSFISITIKHYSQVPTILFPFQIIVSVKPFIPWGQGKLRKVMARSFTLPHAWQGMLKCRAGWFGAQWHCPVRCGVFRSVPGIHPLCASSTNKQPNVVKMFEILPIILWQREKKTA